MKHNNQEIRTDGPYVYNEELPVWLVAVSGWGSEDINSAHERMRAYLLAAEKLKINIQFTTRLGTFQSYKHAPAVAKEIMQHNDTTFAVYTTKLGENWQKTFHDEMSKHLNGK
ncbi:hypothetical protein [Cytophaga hutchinsonii]|jgi:hypothetical protein|uniref:Uncharacterized protein n=1 Tax=Cytophaga hutchinsonii (strain ATCC 33406 / DSM 1761 / CIP 103989 / NBRC 15051 / NCIMB 9469 / D465) TaxID=269798 RepID=A0A6N4STL2_CYTH3|nr:hypothetical protein [Cytophaga hutchinsonii]ABG59564.1 hypothetical protein CHU_2303 [Cytophaga hutchinsonii ATCC 33406]SFX95589.1 hypothetical protein SAMN04487930_11479 [Cytophaga hutchinsonii ATCC 33406]